MPEGSVTDHSTADLLASLARALDSVFPGVAMSLGLRVEMDGKIAEISAEIPARREPAASPAGRLQPFLGQTPKGAA